MKEKMVVSFSGGKTSGFMCNYLIENWSHKYEFVFVFANTGREHEETLKFVKKCDEHFNLNLVWLEGVFSSIKGLGPRHKIVSFAGADRDGGPFREFIKVEGIPNAARPICSERLKTMVIKSFLRDSNMLYGKNKSKIAIGMRADEPSRANLAGHNTKTHNLVYPLAHWDQFDKQDINTYWEYMPFTLEIPEHLGNCVNCFKKSDRKLDLVYQEMPESFDWCHDMEQQHGKGFVFFRAGRSTQDMINEFKMNRDYATVDMFYSEDESGTCTDECGAFN